MRGGLGAYFGERGGKGGRGFGGGGGGVGWVDDHDVGTFLSGIRIGIPLNPDGSCVSHDMTCLLLSVLPHNEGILNSETPAKVDM